MQHVSPAAPKPKPGLFVAVLLATVVLSFAALSLAGGRSYVGFLSGTMPATWAQTALGLADVAAYFAAVLFAPVLAAALAARRLTSASTGPRGRSCTAARR